MTARRERGPASAITPSVDAPASPRRRRLLVAGGSALGTLAAGCGSGIELAGVGSGGTGQVAFSSGPISGFGSVIVNGVKFDDSAASVADDLGQARKLSELGLGMFVEIVGTIDEAAGLGKAQSIRIISQVIGRVDATDLAARRFTVLTVPIAYNDATVWNTNDEQAALVIGGRVEVWGFLDSANGVLRASRIEVNVERPAVTAKLRGPVSEYDRQAAWLRIDQQFVDLRAVPDPLPASIEIGSIVQATGTQQQTPGAPLHAAALSVEPAVLAPSIEEVTLDATIASWNGLERFRVEGFSVDGRSADITGGEVSALAEGVRVRITGSVRGNAVTARSIEIRSLLVVMDNAPTDTSRTELTHGTANQGSQGAAVGDGNASSNDNASANPDAKPNPNPNPNESTTPGITPTAESAPTDTPAAADASAAAGGTNPGSSATETGTVAASPQNTPTAGASPEATPTVVSASPQSTPPNGSAYVEDPVQVTGLITADSALAAIKLLDTAGRSFTVDCRKAHVVNGNTGDLDSGRIIRVDGERATVIEASTIRILT